MKRFGLILMLLAISGISYASGTSGVWRSSYTATADTTKNLCGPDAGINPTRKGFFHGVCISSSVVTGQFTVYNSSAAAINPIAVLDTQSNGCYTYDVWASTVNKGLTYSNSSTGKVTILYDCY